MKPVSPSALLFLIALALPAGAQTQATRTISPETAADSERDENVVALTKENLALISLETEIVARGSLGLMLKAIGRLSENLNRTARVTSTLAGRLVRLNCDLNDRVKAGDVVGLVQTPELLGRELELKAPVDGVIVERKRTVGELVERDTEIYTITDPADLWLLAEIKEHDLGAVRVGQDVAFAVLAYPGETFRGKVTLLGNRIERETRTLEVRVAVDNRDGRLKPGMFADVEIATAALRDVLVVSDAALQTMGSEKVAFVALDERRFEKRIVRTGLEQQGRVQILAGLRVGERVVTAGSFILKAELLKGQLGEE